MRAIAVLLSFAVLAVAALGAVGASSGRAEPGPTGPTGSTGPTGPVTPIPSPTVTAAPTVAPAPAPAPRRGPKRHRPRVFFRVKAGQTARSAAAHGLRVRVRCSRLCGARGRLYRGKRRLGEGIAILDKRRGTVRVPVRRRFRAALTRPRRVRVEVRVQGTSTDALDSPWVRRSVTLKRG